VAARQPAPPPLDLVEDFVNTLEMDWDQRDEALGSPSDLGRWLSERGLMKVGVEPTAAEHARALQVREDLRALLLANNGEPLEEGVVDRMNEAARHAPLTVRFDDQANARLEAAATGTDGALARILGVVFGAIVDGSWARLKACRNEDCTWVFYDSSKNHSATWCSMRACGNRMKARAYRRRRAEEHA
jgi:predicted RNA-binding Zn ribbon-like protein